MRMRYYTIAAAAVISLIASSGFAEPWVTKMF